MSWEHSAAAFKGQIGPFRGGIDRLFFLLQILDFPMYFHVFPSIYFIHIPLASWLVDSGARGPPEGCRLGEFKFRASIWEDIGGDTPIEVRGEYVGTYA